VEPGGITTTLSHLKRLVPTQSGRLLFSGMVNEPGPLTVLQSVWFDVGIEVDVVVVPLFPEAVTTNVVVMVWVVVADLVTVDTNEAYEYDRAPAVNTNAAKTIAIARRVNFRDVAMVI